MNDESDLTAAYAACKQVFGVIAVSRALPCEKDVQAIIRTAKDYLAPEFARAKDFKVESKRADKTFPSPPFSSPSRSAARCIRRSRAARSTSTTPS